MGFTIRPPGTLTPARNYLYLPDGWDACWKAAKAAALAGTGPGTVLFFGDSITQGITPCTDAFATSYEGLVRTALGTTAFDFWPSWDCADVIALGGTPPWVVNNTGGGRSWKLIYGLSYTPTWTDTVTMPEITFTTPYACTDLDLIWLDNVAGTFDLTVDGGSATTITAVGSTFKIRRTRITGLASTTHTITLGNQSAGSNILCPVGIVTYKTAAARTGGLGVARCGTSGQRATHYSVTTRPADSCSQWQGQAEASLTVSTASNTTPVVITTTAAHNLATDDVVTIASVGGTTAANGTWRITVLTTTTFSIKSIAGVAVIGNGAYTSGGTVVLVTGFGFPLQPHLAIVELGINDMVSATVGLATYRATMRRIIEGIQRGRSNPPASVLLLAPMVPNGASSDSASATNYSMNWNLFVGVQRELAEELNCAFLNVHARWGQTGVTQGYIGAANVHPTDAGHADIASALSAIL